MASQTLHSLSDLTLRPAAPRSPRTGAVTAPLLHTLRAWRERARSRHELRSLLRLQAGLGGMPVWQDLGRSRGELIAEANKPFWRA